MLSGFERLSTQEDGERFSVCFDGALFPFYSRRSRPRDVALFKRAIEETPPEMTPILVAPFIADVEEIFTLPRRFYFLAPLFFDTPQIDDARFIGDDAALHQFLRGVESVDKFSIYLPPPWKEAAPYVETGVRQILAQAAARLKTIHHFARLWQTNLRVNARRVINYVDVRTLKESRPTALVMAGPSLDETLQQLSPTDVIWCVDTALPTLLKKGLIPHTVFSIDAGFASREHFVGAVALLPRIRLVCDILGQPAVQRLSFAKRLTYISTNPLVQEFAAAERLPFIAMENHGSDVGSLMRSVYRALFGTLDVSVLGYDRKALRHVTHARGTAYFTRTYGKVNRLTNIETYMLHLSRRYA